MAVKIRLKRMGAKKAPFYRVIVADSRSPRDGRFIDTIGTYNPLTTPAEIKLNEESAIKWLNNGAIPTDTVKNLFSKAGIMEKYLNLIIKKLVKDSESVSVKEFESDEDNTILIEVMVSSEDMPKVIGHGGKTINSIRTIVQAASFNMDNKLVKINVDSY